MKEKNAASERPNNETYRHYYDNRYHCPGNDLDKGGGLDGRSDHEVVFEFSPLRRLIALFRQMDAVPAKRHLRSIIVPEPVRNIVRF